jgi:hypothetical protein
MGIVRAAWCVGAIATGLATPLIGQTSISIYTDGRTVVRRTLPQALAKGRNVVTLELEGVDPAAVFSPDTAVTLLSATLRPATERSRALEQAEGETLSFVRPKGDTVRATVVSASPPQYRLPDGRFLLIEPGEPIFPPELVRTAPQATLILDATRPRPTTELAYTREGARWYAVYQVVLEPGAQAAVAGTATIASQNVRAESALVQLVAGTIARASPPRPVPMAAFAARADIALGPVPIGVGEEAVGEVHTYTLPARITVEPGIAVTSALFPRARVPVTEELIVPGALPFRGYPADMSSSAEPNRVPVQVWYTLKRPLGTPFGDRPLPGGTVQVYQGDSAGRVQLVGEATSGHTAPGRDLRVQSGDAFDVTAERVQTDFTQEPLPAARRGLPARQRTTASYRVTIHNAKAEPVTVDVREARSGTWLVVASSVPAEKLSSTEVRFRVSLPAKGDATLTYTVQVES